MTAHFNLVVPKNQPPSEQQYHDALIAGLARCAKEIGRGTLADKSFRSTRALDKLFSGGSTDTSGKGLLDFLCAHPGALDEVLALYGYRVSPLDDTPASDFNLIADAAALQAEHADALRDGRRCHNETQRIADKARPVVAQYTAIIAEADKIRGLA